MQLNSKQPDAGSLKSRANRLAASWRRRFGVAPELMVLADEGFDLSSWLDASASIRHDWGESIFGSCQETPVLVVQGLRPFGVDGDLDRLSLPVVAAARWGVSLIVHLAVTSGLREDIKPGGWVMLTDHINLTGHSPLAGRQDVFHNQHPDTRDLYDQATNGELVNVAALVGVHLRLGTGAFIAGPQYPTPAEAEVFRRIGANLLGFSIGLQVVAAHALEIHFSTLACCADTAGRHHGRHHSYKGNLEECGFFSGQAIRILQSYLRYRKPETELPLETLLKLTMPGEVEEKPK